MGWLVLFGLIFLVYIIFRSSTKPAKNNTITNKLPISKIFAFTRVESDFEIQVGDEVNLWNKPNSNKVNLYVKGHGAGRGLIGYAYNSIISNHLAKTEYLFVENEIKGITSKQIELFVHMFKDEEASFGDNLLRKNRWLEKIRNNYNPRSSWDLRFLSSEPFEKDCVKIETISKDLIDKYYHKREETIWLINKDGAKIDARNTSTLGGIDKILRAHFSGHQIKIEDIRVEDNFYAYCYFITVGIE